MQIHQLKPSRNLKKSKRVGRGGKRGTFSGRGTKGQIAHAGRRMEPIIRTLVKRYPKLRGYSFKTKGNLICAINIGTIDEKFEDGATVNPQFLVEKRIIRKIGGKIPEVKILGRGELKKNLVFEKCLFSKNAKEKIEKTSSKIAQ